jgi:hypothetical protein
MDDIIFEYFSIGSPDAPSFEEFWDVVDRQTGEPVEDNPSAFYLTLSTDDEFRRRVLTLKIGDGLTWSEVEKSVHIVIPNSKLRFIRSDMSLLLSFWCETETGELDAIETNRTVQAVRVG